MVHVCHVVEAGGGVKKHLLNLAKYMPKDVIRQTFLISPIRSDGTESELIELGFQCKLIRMYRAINPIKDMVALVELYLFFRNNKIDIVHCHSSKAGFLGRIAAFLAGIPVRLYSPHAFPFNNFISKIKKYLYIILERFASYFTTYIIASSKGEAEQASQDLRVSLSKITLIENAIDVSQYTVHIELDRNIKLQQLGIEISNKTKIIGFIGRLTQQKDPQTLLEALRLIKEENFILLIVGDGELKEKLVKQVTSFNLQSKVYFLGYRDDLVDMLNLFDIFVLPSLWEGMPYVLLEAMVSKKAIITTNVTGNKDVIKNNETGFLIEAQDYKTLAEKLEQLLNDHNLMKEIGCSAHRYVIANHSIDRMIMQHVGLYTKLKGK